VRRRLSLRRRILLAALGVVVVLAGLAWPLAHSSLLSANVLTVTGAANTGDAAVLRASGLAGHPPMVDVNAGLAARRIEALPWVATAAVSLDWPDGVSVRVRERTAVAVVADGAGWGELDRTGRVVATVQSPPAGLPHLVSGPKPGRPGTTLAGARPSLDVAGALPVAFKSLVAAVSRSPGGGVDLALSDGIGVVLGTATQLPAKFEDVASLLAGAGLAPGSVIDVSVPDTPLVRPPAGSSPAASAGSSPAG
jgi:cell division protein FtsQ